MMKRFCTFFTILFLICGIATSASALTYGLGYSEIGIANDSMNVGTKAYVRSGGTLKQGGLALSYSAGEPLDGDYYCGVLDGWADAYAETSSSDAFAYTGPGFMGSEAYASAGDGLAERSGAVAANFVVAYDIILTEGTYVDLNIYYDLGAETYTDNDGTAYAGAAALVGIYSGLDDSDDSWEQLVGTWMDDYGTEGYFGLEKLYLEAGTYTVFAGTAAWAYAYEAKAVPEPAFMLLLGTGLIGIAGFGRKKLLK